MALKSAFHQPRLMAAGALEVSGTSVDPGDATLLHRTFAIKQDPNADLKPVEANLDNEWLTTVPPEGAAGIVAGKALAIGFEVYYCNIPQPAFSTVTWSQEVDIAPAA